MPEWNAFDSGKPEDIEHSLGEPIGLGKLCDCTHYFSNHDELGCVRRGCQCKINLTTLIMDEKRKDKS